MNLNFRRLETKSKSPLWIFPQPNANSVALGVLIFAGTRDENWPKEAGIAHALEHMHFQGTEKFPSSAKISGFVEEVGGRLNAWTWKEMTFHHVYMPAEHARRGVEILSQQMLASVFPEERVPVEMKNIIQELRRRNDDPRGAVGEIGDELIYGKHPLGKDTLGTEEALNAFKRDDFINFKKRYYNSSNMVFIVAGNIDDKAAVDLFDEFFPFEPGERNIRKPEEVSDVSAKLRVEKKDIEQVHLVLNAITGEAASKDASVIELFGYMISGGMSFPLFQEVRNKRGLCYEVHGGLNRWSDASNFDIYVGTDPKRYKEAIDATIEVIEKSKSDSGLMERAKALRIGRLALDFENMYNVINIASRDITFLGAPRGYEQIKSEIEKITIEDVGRAVDKYLLADKLSKTLLVPEDFKE